MNISIEDHTTQPLGATRKFSKRLIANLTDFDASKTFNGKQNDRVGLAQTKDLLLQIASEASFLGHSRILQLCKAVRAALDAIAEGKSKNDVSCQRSVIGAIQAIAASVRMPNLASVEAVDGLIRELSYAADLSVEALHEPIELSHTNFQSSLKNEETNFEQKEHRDESVYCKEVIQDLDYCADEESWIVSQLASVAEDLAAGQSADRPAYRLLSVLRGHRFFERVDRVCLAGRVPSANQLVVVDSATSPRISKNLLKKGYSCFVNPKGSLFSMKPSTVRIFGECNSVLASFEKNHRPAQRSIALVAEQGLRSGLCIAIGRESSLQGFLFLNSLEPSLFDNITSRYAPLLSLFGLLGTVSLDASGFHSTTYDFDWICDDAMPRHAIVFDAIQLQDWLSMHFKKWFGWNYKVALERNDHSQSFLYLPAMLIEALCELVSRSAWHSSMFKADLSISVARAGETVCMSFKSALSNADVEARTRMKSIVSIMNSRLANTTMRWRVDGDCVLLEFPYEPTLGGGSGHLYSIVY